MFKPDSDRLDYSQIIMPPPLYETAFAVGTTYSMDLETLLGIPLALSLSQSMDSQLQESGLHLLEAIRKSAEKINVFCQGGKISVPAEKRTVFSLLENSVFQVLPKKDYSFHPKAWFIKYVNPKNEDDIKYKIIVLSRNLTFDRSWDIAASIDGVKEKKEYEINQPISDFINYLSGFATDPKRRKNIRAFAKEIMQVKFELSDRRFSEFSFHPIGIPGYTKETVGIFDDTFHSMAVVSPFLSKTSIEKLDELRLNSAELLLISRKLELYKLDNDLVKRVNCYHMKDSVIDGEDNLDDDGTTPSKQDIHAKLYLKTKHSTTELWLGSANCSYKAFNGNIEFLLRLKGYKSYYSINNFKTDLFGNDEKANPFEQFYGGNIKEADKNPLDEIVDKFIRELCKIKSEAKVEKVIDVENKYNIVLTFQSIPNIPEDAKVEIYPLMKPQRIKAIEQILIFENLDLTDLGMFYGVKITLNEIEKQIAIKITTEGIPDIRDSEIFKKIIKDKDGFYQYIAFILGDDFLLTSLEDGLAKEGSSFKFVGYGFDKPVLYEKMLKAASRNPERLIEIKKLMEFILKNDESIVPQDFIQLYDIFDKTVNKNRRIK